VILIVRLVKHLMINRNLQRHLMIWPWIVTLGLLLAALLQWHTVSRLRHENESLHAHQRPLAVSDQPVPSESGQGLETPEMQKDKIELLRLRNEVRQLREGAARTASNGLPPAPQLDRPTPAEGQERGDDARSLAMAAMQGDSGALDKLAMLAVAARTMETDARDAAQAALTQAFGELGTAAGKGNATALKAVWQASRMQDLQGFAVAAFGQAAAQGDEEALEPLLHPENYLILRSSATGALKPAADAGNPLAIQALAATAADQSQTALWYLAAQGLETAAATGDATAIDSLAALAAVEDQNVGKEAILALEAAARKNQPRAEQALKKLGWR
jgi:hypothetical protein